MTAGQEGKDITEFLIHTVNLPKFSESETLFFLFPSCPAVILPWNKHYHTSKNSNSFIYHILKGFYDRSILAKVKGGKLITLAMNNPVVSNLSREVNFPGKSPFPGSHLSWEVKFRGKSPFPGSHLYREVTFPGKSNFPGSHIKQTYVCPNVPMSAKYHTCHAGINDHMSLNDTYGEFSNT